MSYYRRGGNSRIWWNRNEIDTTVLETELNEINGLNIESKGQGDDLPWTVTAKGFKFQIKEDGTIEEVNGISLLFAINGSAISL